MVSRTLSNFLKRLDLTPGESQGNFEVEVGPPGGGLPAGLIRCSSPNRSESEPAMRFSALEIPDAMLICHEPLEDARGDFARIFSADEFAANGLPYVFAYAALSTNRKAGTLRGLHYQFTPQEAKLVRCVRGAIYDVIVDLRTDSAQFGRWRAIALSEDQPFSVFVPKGCAHGFQTLVDHAELLYHIDAPFNPPAAAGIRWDDPTLNIEWPLADPILSDRDRALPFLR